MRAFARGATRRSVRASLAVKGRDMLYAFCAEHHVNHARCGKLLVATSAGDVPKLAALKEKAEKNGVADLTIISAEDAAAYCEALELGGRDDWRLPLRIELVSILDGTVTPTLDAAAFPDTVEDYHWSASRPRHSDTLGYSAYFGQGETVTAALSGSGAHVRCVAGAIAVGEPWVVEDGEVRMPSLALAWADQPTRRSWC